MKVADAPQADSTTVKYQKLIPNCQICKKTTADHYFAKVASTAVSDENKPRILALHEHVRKHEWNALANQPDFSRCPHDINRGDEFIVQNEFLLQDLHCFLRQRNVELSKRLAILEYAVPAYCKRS